MGSYNCTCIQGYSGNGFHCKDVNECMGPGETHKCHADAACSNTPGSYECVCNDGYDGDGFDCVKQAGNSLNQVTTTAIGAGVHECLKQTHGCHADATCTNDHGSYSCACNDGYSGNGKTCTDVNECDTDTDNCHVNASCANSYGSYNCTCIQGYSGNGFHCKDVNECMGPGETHKCHADAVCSNTPGSYECVCNDGYDGDGFDCLKQAGNSLNQVT